MEHTAEARRARLNPEGAHTYDLSTVVSSLWGETEARENGRTGVTLVKTPSTCAWWRRCWAKARA